MSGPAGRDPGRWDVRRIRGGDLIRAVRKVPGKTRGACTDPGCDWPGPVGATPHNISRECMRHTRKTGHETRFATVEVVAYRLPGGPVRVLSDYDALSRPVGLRPRS